VADKKKYYKLDDIGIVGNQEKKSAASRSYHKKKTGDAFRKAKATSVTTPSPRLKKAS
jgi:hypothetical protein